jgi:hypothetical protein
LRFCRVAASVRAARKIGQRSAAPATPNPGGQSRSGFRGFIGKMQKFNSVQHIPAKDHFAPVWQIMYRIRALNGTMRAAELFFVNEPFGRIFFSLLQKV